MLACYRLPKRKHRKPLVDRYKATDEEYKRLLAVMVERQLGRCAMCLKVCQHMTFDHEAGRGHGGGHRCDRIWNEDGTPKNAALCAPCNSLKSSRRYHWVEGSYVPKEK